MQYTQCYGGSGHILESTNIENQTAPLDVHNIFADNTQYSGHCSRDYALLLAHSVDPLVVTMALGVNLNLLMTDKMEYHEGKQSFNVM